MNIGHFCIGEMVGHEEVRLHAKKMYYKRFSILFFISMASMMAGAQVVHMIFKPDLRLIPSEDLPPRKDRMNKA